jgi:hypothetical protein
MTSAWPEQRIAETVAASGWIHVALEGRRIDRLHARQNKGGAVALTQEAGAVGEIELSGDRVALMPEAAAIFSRSTPRLVWLF